MWSYLAKNPAKNLAKNKAPDWKLSHVLGAKLHSPVADHALSEPRCNGTREDHSMDIAKPYLPFPGGVHDRRAAKTAMGIVSWRPAGCVGPIRCGR
jgi:hypothetical protein